MTFYRERKPRPINPTRYFGNGPIICNSELYAKRKDIRDMAKRRKWTEAAKSYIQREAA